jgi:D-aminopeptidase
VPVVLVTGDDVVAEQIREVVGDIEAAVVKESLTAAAAITLHPKKARALIREHARKSIQRLSEFKPLRFSSPYTLEFTWPPGSPLKEHMNKLQEAFPKLKDQPGDRFALTTDSLEEISDFIDQTAILWGLGVIGPSG